MPEYDVIVTRDVTESAVVRVKATCRGEAEVLALKASQDPATIWGEDDLPFKVESYVTDVSERVPGEAQ